MSLRTQVRRLRLYYKPHTRALYRQAFENYQHARWFPFWGEGEFVPRNGMRPIRIPRRYWDSLATAARLVLMGAYPRWESDALTIEYDGLTFRQPPWEKWTPQGMFIDDAWRINKLDLTGKTVIDVGAFIGDSSIAFAVRGAKVHAFEAVPLFADFVSRNVVANHLEDSIAVHPVALSNRNSTVSETARVMSIASMSHNCLASDEAPSQEVALVDAIPYLKTNGIDHADMLKMNCEGCEYDLLGDGELLDFLQPDWVAIDYHFGANPLLRILRDRGYEVECSAVDSERGEIFAHRAQRAS